ncbi:hypothetical protein [Fructilactobacillus florum]|uniref:Uncharacterized protein n=2 Tax=Fructilactobacillus florum TaxID=640331 RepID=A0A0R2CQE1_9LACO|nr:hypothetical protein [Fructilactobacillus florum]KRM90585.1 hypothetical protein FC87_GL001272 [Fructilactobacillus florum DSM 22689 = JCM 16035]
MKTEEVHKLKQKRIELEESLTEIKKDYYKKIDEVDQCYQQGRRYNDDQYYRISSAIETLELPVETRQKLSGVMQNFMDDLMHYRNNSNRSLEEELEEKTSKVQRKIDEIDTEI